MKKQKQYAKLPIPCYNISYKPVLGIPDIVFSNGLNPKLCALETISFFMILCLKGDSYSIFSVLCLLKYVCIRTFKNHRRGILAFSFLYVISMPPPVSDLNCIDITPFLLLILAVVFL